MSCPMGITVSCLGTDHWSDLAPYLLQYMIHFLYYGLYVFYYKYSVVISIESYLLRNECLMIFFSCHGSALRLGSLNTTLWLAQQCIVYSISTLHLYFIIKIIWIEISFRLPCNILFIYSPHPPPQKHR